MEAGEEKAWQGFTATTKHGLQSMDYKAWTTKHGLQSMEYEDGIQGEVRFRQLYYLKNRLYFLQKGITGFIYD